MHSRNILAAIAATAALVTTASCHSGAPEAGAHAASGAALQTIVNPSTHAGGTLRLQVAQDWDSPDPGNDYYTWEWDFARLYARPLLSYANAPGAGGLRLEPDLATGLGEPSDGDRVWTYHIRPGVRFSNGKTITSADVAYAVERSGWGKGVLPDGPSYFLDLIDPKAPAGQSWAGPYKDPGSSAPASMIATPDPSTIVFHLVKPFADFDYVAALPQTAPVPRAEDTGATYWQHIVSSGPYTIDSYQPGIGMTLSRNPYWNPATDPGHLHPQLLSHIDVRTKVASSTIDQNLVAGQANVELSGAGLTTTTVRDHVLTDPTLRDQTDDADNGGTIFAAINVTVPPFTNLDCRKAVEYAANKPELVEQAGGATAGSAATTILAPTVTGYHTYPNPYATPDNAGDPSKARQLLAACRAQLGSAYTSTVNLATQSDQPTNVAVMTALTQELDQIGLHANLERFPSTFYGTTVGTAAYMNAHHLGIMTQVWGADWPDGYGFLEPLIGRLPNLSEFDNPAISAMLASASTDPDSARRDADWSRIDQAVMRQAPLVPLIYTRSLLYRPPSDTNVVFSDAYGAYNYSLLGTSR